MGIHLLLDAGNALDAAGNINVSLAGDHALRRQCNGLQAGRAKAVDRHARDCDGAAGAQGDLAGDIGAGRAFGRRAAHDHVIDFGGFDAGAGHGVLNGMAAEGCAVRHVESALPAFGQRGAGGGYDES